MPKPVLYTILSYLRWVALGAAVAAAVYFGATFRNLPRLPERDTGPMPKHDWPKPVAIPSEQWMVFGRTSDAGPGQESPLARRFRLAGTFFVFSDSGAGGDSGGRRAILDDLEKGQQYLVSEGQSVDAYEVARIFQDRVVLRSGGAETELWLSFTDAADRTNVQQSAQSGPATEHVLATSRFGDQVGSNRWVLTRDKLLGYYRELLDDPERIAALYMSLKPKYQDDEVSGYYLDVEGEGEFFKAAGLEPGDVIRKVNSMNMTSQKRAEYFISEFVKDRVNALVIDIERNGKPEKLIYLIR